MTPQDITIKKSDTSESWAYAEVGDKKIALLAQNDSDGLWRLHRMSNTGMIDAWVLRAIADRLDEMNKEWNEELERAYKSIDDEENSFAP